MNWEHPWLGKYLIMASMAIRDGPIYWRIPSITLGALSLVLAYSLTKKLTGSERLGGVASSLLLMDETFRALSQLAMLDIYVGFFTLFAVYLAYVDARKSEVAPSTLASIACGLALASKYTGLFTLLGLYYAGRGKSRLLVGAIGVFLLAHLPIIAYLEVPRYIDEVKNAINWFTTPRLQGPASSTPLDWLFGVNPFTLSESPELEARGLPGVYALSLASAIWLLIKRQEFYSSSVLLASWLGYWLIALLGNTTLYSYYEAQFAPLVPVVIATAISRFKRRFVAIFACSLTYSVYALVNY